MALTTITVDVPQVACACGVTVPQDGGALSLAPDGVTWSYSVGRDTPAGFVAVNIPGAGTVYRCYGCVYYLAPQNVPPAQVVFQPNGLPAQAVQITATAPVAIAAQPAKL